MEMVTKKSFWSKFIVDNKIVKIIDRKGLPAKRAIDIILSLLGLLVLLPLLPFIGIAIKLDSMGPIFYLADRIGKDMVNFKMYKFRTMIDTPVQVGQSVCPQYDPRVTKVGKFLRRTKLNELPQLINILKGQMTFVGPRPEAPDLAEGYSKEAKIVFTVKPGLVSPASILCRNEEECYPPGVNAKQHYFENLLPEKLRLDLAYINNQSIFKDFQYIFMGIKETFVGAISKKHLYDNLSQICLFLADFLITLFVFLMMTAALSMFSANIDSREIILFCLVGGTVRMSFYSICGMYSSLIRYISVYDIKHVLYASTAGGIVLLLVAKLVNLNHYTVAVAIVESLLLSAILSGLRIILRFYHKKKYGAVERYQRRRVLIYGVDDYGYLACNILSSSGFSPYDIVGFIDDNTSNLGKTVNGYKVLGNRHHIGDLTKLYHIEEIIISRRFPEIRNLLELICLCNKLDIECRVLPYIKRPIKDTDIKSFIRSIELSDILPHPRAKVDSNAIGAIINGKNILLNGSGGSLGVELACQLTDLGCRSLIIVDRYEAYLLEAASAIQTLFPQANIIPILGGNGNSPNLEDIFVRYHPEIVIHGAIRKYESIYKFDIENQCERDLDTSLDLAELAARYKTNLFLLLSSTPDTTSCSSYISKLLQQIENALIHFFKTQNTKLIIPRLCDIAENRGGIVSILEGQIINHGRVMLPERNRHCYLTTKSSAAEFILQCVVQAVENPKSDSVFQCNIGVNIELIELVQTIAAFHGMNPWTDLEVRFMKQSTEHFLPPAYLNAVGR